MGERQIYFSRQGAPLLDVLKWSKIFEEEDRVVAQTELKNGKLVSTVWLGVDLNFKGVGQPLIFETMVFSKGDREELACERYSTENEAMAGHKKIVSEEEGWLWKLFSKWR